MQLLKIAGNIWKAKLTKREEDAMNREIQNMVAEYDRKNQREIDAMVLMILHTEFGWGMARLKQFHNRFIRKMDELCARYEAPIEDQKYIALEWCKEYGIDLDEWGREYDDEIQRRDVREGDGNSRGTGDQDRR